MYAIRNRNDPSIYFHYPETGGARRTTLIENFQKGKVPRLFSKERHARSALNNWLIGKQLVYGPTQKIVPVASRKKEDWEIIPIMVVPKGLLIEAAYNDCRLKNYIEELHR